MKDTPVLILAATIWAYWGTVALLVLAKRLRHGQSSGVVPRQRFERRLWLVMAPMVLAWLAFPLLILKGRVLGFALPGWAAEVPVVAGFRWAAAGVGVACYLLSVYCWLVLGRNWSMAIVPGQTAQLVTAGLYRWVRHPIYGLSVTLMLASVAAAPVAPLALLACVHLVVMNLKARNEERHLEAHFGPAYADYCQRAGRFWPRLTLNR